MEIISYNTNNENTPSYNEWCKMFKVGSRYIKPNTMKQYREGEYDYNKFIKMIQYDKQTEKITIWKQISKAFSTLRSRKV